MLTEQAKKRGVHIVNHSPVLELFRDADGITGALALDISSDEPAYRIVKAKAVVVATGYVSRLFTTDPTPSQMFNTNMCPSGTGDSIAQAWRLGAHLVNMEKTYRHARAPGSSPAAARPHGSASTATPTASPSARSSPSPTWKPAT